MRACIARGSEEVGGSSLLVQAEAETTIALDLGSPLDGRVATLPSACHDFQLAAVLISHGHPDHYGLVELLPRSVPIHIAPASAAILREAAFFGAGGLERPTLPLVAGRRLRIGSLAVTPLPVDHSAFASVAFLVEADGASLLYSGDLRAHGRTAPRFERLIAAARGVDALVLEGTTLSRTSAESGLTSEAEVEDRMVESIRGRGGIALACFSPQNVDRLVSAYRAALRSGRELVLDLYGVAVAMATGWPTIPKPGWSSLRVYVPRSQRLRVKRARQFHRLAALGASRIYAEELAAEPNRWVMGFRTSTGPELERAGCLRDAAAIWALWPGYLERDSGLGEWFHRRRIPLTLAHASGHAPPADLRRLAAAIGPRELVPIHTEAPERFATLGADLHRRRDGEWWRVGAP